MKVQNTIAICTKSFPLGNLDRSVRLESRNNYITTQQREIKQRKSQIIAFVVNAGVNYVILLWCSNTRKGCRCSKCLLYSTKVWSRYSGNMLLKGQITISSDSSPLFGIQFLAIPFAFDFVLRCISKKKASNTQ